MNPRAFSYAAGVAFVAGGATCWSLGGALVRATGNVDVDRAYDYLGDTRTVDVHMRRLRQKIEDAPSSPVLLKTVHGIGYKFQYEEPK